MAAVRIVKQLGEERINACRDVLDEIKEILEKDLNLVYKSLLDVDVTNSDWPYTQAIKVGEAKSLQNLIEMIK